jgi:beta-glucosidase
MPFRWRCATSTGTARPCHVSPLIETELRRWAQPTGHGLFLVSDAEAPSNLVDPEHYFDDHAAGRAAALKAGTDSFTDQNEDSTTVIGRLREALDRGLIDEADIDRAARRHLQLRCRLKEPCDSLTPSLPSPCIAHVWPLPSVAPMEAPCWE